LSTALVPLVPTEQAAADLRSTGRPHADFIAHLIAMSSQAPQTRVHRRAAPDEVTASYRALDRWRPVPGRVLSRSL